jgi:hypothetical protein
MKSMLVVSDILSALCLNWSISMLQGRHQAGPGPEVSEQLHTADEGNMPLAVHGRLTATALGNQEMALSAGRQLEGASRKYLAAMGLQTMLGSS